MTFFWRAGTFFGERPDDPAASGNRPHGAVPQETEDSRRQ